MRMLSLAVAAAALGVFAAATDSQAGDGNVIHIKQESPAGSQVGNSLSINQFEANGSLVAGPSVPSLLPYLGLTLDTAASGSLRPALQRGEGNEATVTMKGDGGTLLLLQDTSPGMRLQTATGGTSNVATVNTAGAALGAVIQMGTGNDATLDLDNSRGLIGQFGTNLTANLSVGERGNGQIVQVGNGSTAALTVPEGASATYVQIGNGLESVGQTGVQIITATNPGMITINQTAW